MRNNAWRGPRLRKRRSGVRIFSASIVGLSTLAVIGGFALLKYDGGNSPLLSRLTSSAQSRFQAPLEARLENPSPPRDIAQTEAARVDAEKRIADAMALQFSTVPSVLQSSAAPQQQASVAKQQGMSAEARLAELPRDALPRSEPVREAVVQADGGSTVVARAAPAPAPAPAPQNIAALNAATAPGLPGVSSMPAEEQAAMMARVAGLMRQGDVGAARAILKRLVRENNPQAAYSLARSYDPQVLREERVIGIRPDPELARDLYEQALRGGVKEARSALATLQAPAQ